MRFAPQPTQIRCPFCQSPIVVPVQRVIDALDEPELKARLLSGRLNAFTCPNCRNSGALAAPLIYHDAGKELALIFLPLESGMNNVEQQRVIGQLTQAVMNSVPQEQRKAYLLQPQQFVTLQSLLNRILEADGITPEMIQAQQARVDLLQRLIDARDDATFTGIVKENEAHIDVAFLQLLSMAMSSAQADNQAEEFTRLNAMRDRLLELTPIGQTVKTQTAAVEAFGANPTRENLLAQLTAAPDSATREALLIIGRPLLDYPFFQQLTGQIESARKNGDAAEADRLTELRKEILALRDRLDAEAQSAVQRRAEVVRELLVSENLEQAVRARAAVLDDLFFQVLTAEMQNAQQTGDGRLVERLQTIGNTAFKVVQERQPPEVRFLSALLAARHPDQTRQLLERNRRALVPEFIAWLEAIVADFEEDGRNDSAEHLRQVIAQARELAGIPAG
jgi:hypothetical protein